MSRWNIHAGGGRSACVVAISWILGAEAGSFSASLHDEVPCNSSQHRKGRGIKASRALSCIEPLGHYWTLELG